MRKVTLELQEDSQLVNVSIQTPKGTMNKRVVFNTIASALQGRKVFTTNLMPPGIIKYCFDENNMSYKVVFYQDERIRTINYVSRAGTTTSYTVPTPNTVYFLSLEQDQGGKLSIKNSRFFAARGRIASEKDKLFALPMNNVHADGAVCWGSVQKRGINSLIEVESLINMFWLSRFNSDLNDGLIAFEHEGNNISTCKHLMQLLDGKVGFPYEVLREDRSFSAIFEAL